MHGGDNDSTIELMDINTPGDDKRICKASDRGAIISTDGYMRFRVDVLAD